MTGSNFYPGQTKWPDFIQFSFFRSEIQNLGPDDLRGDDHVRKTDLVLANAIYFKGKWDMPFYERDTKERLFYRLDGTAVDVPFMYNSSRHFIAVHDGFKVLKLQYNMQQQQQQQDYSWTPNFMEATQQYSMCIFLPDAYDGLRTLLDAITSRPSFVQEHLPRSEVRVRDFGVPKFKLVFMAKVAQILKDLGLVLPFGMGADLSDMMEAGLPLVVQEVFHKAVIEVKVRKLRRSPSCRGLVDVRRG